MNSDNSGLSTGAKAGIGVGAAAGAIFVIGGVAFFFYRRGKLVGAKGAGVGATGSYVTELAGTEIKQGAGNLAELAEGGAPRVRAELQG